MPSDDLKLALRRMLTEISELSDPLMREHVVIGLNNRPSRPSVRLAFGLDDASETAWRQGRPRCLKYTKSLLEIVRAEFWRLPARRKETAERVWSAYRPKPDFLEGLETMLEAHRERLEEEDRRDALARTNPRNGKARRQRDTSPRTSKAGSGSAVPPPRLVAVAPSTSRTSSPTWSPAPALPPPWAAPWLERQVGGWATHLISGDDRVVYIYGARKSGRSALIDALQQRLEGEAAPAKVLRLNINRLVSIFESSRDPLRVRQAILDGLRHELAPDSPPRRLERGEDFGAAMTEVLSLAPAGHIYLFLLDADVCLRHPEAAVRDALIEATTPLYTFLRPVADEEDDPLLRRVSVVLEGARPLSALCTTYPASPLNVGAIYTLGRFKPEDCAEQARLAGLKEGGGEPLWALTKGHRSLLWPILRSVTNGAAAPAVPPEPENLPAVRRVLGELIEELALQPSLATALEAIRKGGQAGLDEGTRLQATMYLNRSVPPSVGCRLLEAALDEAADAT